MLQPSTPRDYVLLQLRSLDEYWPVVRDADVDAVHQARVATRRIRAALPFVWSASDSTRSVVRSIGRRLGRVRELDVTDALLTKLEGRVGQAPRVIALLRRDVRARLGKERRKMIKAVDRPPRSIAHAIAHRGALARIGSLWRDWRSELRADIRRRASQTLAALHRATAVYMPNRSHAARIAIKKLRYELELAAAVELMNVDGILDDIKAAQDALGELHDLHVVSQMLSRFDTPKPLDEEAATLGAVVDAEVARVHGKYLRQRERLYAACGACRRLAAVGRMAHVVRVMTRALPAAALVGVPAATLYSRYIAVPESPHHESPDETGVPRSRPRVVAARL